MISSVVTLFVLVLMLADLGLLIACLIVGPKMKAFCLLGVWANGLLAVGLLGLAAVLIFQAADAEQRGLAWLLGTGACGPWLLGFAAYAATYKWRMKEPALQQSPFSK